MACNPGRSALGRIPKENSKCQRYGLSGGKDSAALAVYMRDRLLEMEYIFHDTDKELPETLVSRAAAKRNCSRLRGSSWVASAIPYLASLL